LARREAREAEKAAVKEHVKKIFEESEGTYGPDRICGVLRQQGFTASYEKIKEFISKRRSKSLQITTAIIGIHALM